MMNEKMYETEPEGVRDLDIERAWELLLASKKRVRVVVAISPAVRVTVGEAFGLDRGEDAIGKIASALKLLGADYVVDTAIANDVVALSEKNEFLSRVESGKHLPLIVSRSSAFAAWGRENFPKLSENLSCTPSPALTAGMLLKKYFDGAKDGIVTKVIAVEQTEMAKAETAALGKELRAAVDLVLTTGELISMLNQADFNVVLMGKTPLETPLGVSSGAAYLSATDGGAAESLVRCLLQKKTTDELRKLRYSGLYGKSEKRETEFSVSGKTLKFAVVCGEAETRKLFEKIENGESEYDYVEVSPALGGLIAADGVEANRTQKLRALGLGYLAQGKSAVSADGCPAAQAAYDKWLKLKWEREALDEEVDLTPEVIEFSSADEEIIEPETVETVEAVETVEVVKEPKAEEAMEVVEAIAVVETVETIEKPKKVEEHIEEAVQEIAVTEAVEELEGPPQMPVEESVEEPEEEEPAEENESETEIEEPFTFDEEAAKKAGLSEEEIEILKREPYYRRLSTKERRKLRRIKRKLGK